MITVCVIVFTWYSRQFKEHHGITMVHAKTLCITTVYVHIKWYYRDKCHNHKTHANTKALFVSLHTSVKLTLCYSALYYIIARGRLTA